MVRGVQNACLYDTLGGDMQSLYKLESDFLAQAQGPISVEDLLAQRPDDERQRLLAFLAQLGERNLARQYDEPYYVKPLERGLGGGFITFFQPTRLQVLFLELNQDCGLDCLFCHPRDIAGRGTGCGRHGDANGTPLTSERRKELISQAADLGAMELQLCGGDALAAPGWEDLATTALARGFLQVTIWTTGLRPIDDRWLRNPRVKFALQVFSSVEKVHDEVAGRRGAFTALVGNLEQMRERDGNPLLTLVVTRRNEEDCERAQSFFQSFTKLPLRVAPLYPTGGSGLAPVGPGAKFLGVRHWFMRVDLRYLSVFEGFHPCLSGKMAVTVDGRVLPCLAGRSWTMGDAHTEDLWNILSSGRHKPYWELTKARLGKCSRCEFRLGCFDCRVIQGDGESLTEVNHCDYDPVTGTWGPEDGRSQLQPGP
jgi:radical SAM protein with 4Fe4S-binding SPASM domain